jgi:hypothetical protein
MHRAYDAYPLLWCAPQVPGDPPARVLAVMLWPSQGTRPYYHVSFLHSLRDLVSPRDMRALEITVGKLAEVRAPGARHPVWGPFVSWGQHFSVTLDMLNLGALGALVSGEAVKRQLTAELTLRYSGDQFCSPA